MAYNIYVLLNIIFITFVTFNYRMAFWCSTLVLVITALVLAVSAIDMEKRRICHATGCEQERPGRNIPLGRMG